MGYFFYYYVIAMKFNWNGEIVMTTTIKDVAKLAGVSISTVSRVINNSKPVSLEVRKKVLDAIKELDYKPNEVARSLVTRKSNLIGVIVTDLGNSYIAEMVRGIEEIGQMYNYDIILSSSYGNIDAEMKFVKFLTSKQVEGIVLISEKNDNEVIDEIQNYNIPFIYLNRYCSKSDLSTVSIDNYKACYSMVEYLSDLGHENILYISYENDDEYSVEISKIEGYNKAIQDKEKKGSVYYAKGLTIQDGYDIGKSVLQFVRENDISAIFCCHDEIAIGLMSYCYDKKIRVPEDISICGFGDKSIASIYRPRLTTVREPFYDIGAVAIRSVIKKINGQELKDDKLLLPFQIMKRESCAKIR